MGILFCPRCRAMAEDSTKEGAIEKIDHAVSSKTKCSGSDDICLWYPKDTSANWKTNGTRIEEPVPEPEAGRPIQGLTSDAKVTAEVKVTKKPKSVSN